jgi:hypothetical protein
MYVLGFDRRPGQGGRLAKGAEQSTGLTELRFGGQGAAPSSAQQAKDVVCHHVPHELVITML